VDADVDRRQRPVLRPAREQLEPHPHRVAGLAGMDHDSVAEALDHLRPVIAREPRCRREQAERDLGRGLVAVHLCQQRVARDVGEHEGVRLGATV
jgi:hypothetical protein